MHFCTNCENMLYISFKEQDANNLIYYCRQCGNTEDLIDKTNICLMKTEINTSSNDNYFNNINKYTKEDKTLPKTQNIKCPNSDCPSNNGSKNEVVYIRFNQANLEYIYLCTLCDKSWKTINN